LCDTRTLAIESVCSDAMTTPKTPIAHPFGALAALRDQLPAQALPQHAAPSAVASAKPTPKGPARAVVRIERKQRGGKEVTVIDKLALPPAQLATWCKELKAALGCGGTVDGDTILLQGDLRPRLAALLTARGVGKVTIAP
jgi:translation initiation factor 1